MHQGSYPQVRVGYHSSLKPLMLRQVCCSGCRLLYAQQAQTDGYLNTVRYIISQGSLGHSAPQANEAITLLAYNLRAARVPLLILFQFIWAH